MVSSQHGKGCGICRSFDNIRSDCTTGYLHIPGTPAAILILGTERGHIYISLFIVVFFTSGIVFYFWSFIATEEREVVDFAIHLRQCSKVFYEINTSNKAL